MDATTLTITVNTSLIDIATILAQHLKEIEDAFDDVENMDDECTGQAGERLKKVIRDKSYLEKIEGLNEVGFGVP